MRVVARIKWYVVAFMAVMLIYVVQSCTKEKIIIYSSFTGKVTLISPPGSGSVNEVMPTLIWQTLDEAVLYEVQVSADAAFSEIVLTDTVDDTVYTDTETYDNGLYYWRVRARNSDDMWADWSDATIWSFSIDDSNQFFNLLSYTPTPGSAQDIFVVEEMADSIIAYVADGQAGLTIINVTDPDTTRMVGNVDHYNGDFASAVWKLPGDEIAYLADMDGKIAAIDTRLPLDPNSMYNVNLGFDQNLEELTGIVFQDTIYLFAVNSLYTHRIVSFYQIVYRSGIPGFGDFYVVPPFNIPADGKGVCFDSSSIVVEYYDSDRDSTRYEEQTGMFIFTAASQAGLWWFDISQTRSFGMQDTALIYSPRYLGWGDTPSNALSVFAKDGFVYVADDRGGLQIFDLPDTIPAFDHQDTYEVVPELVADINTSGRTKDIHVVGNFCYLADGSGGLKIVDVTNPHVPVFLAAYDTPYAVGVWADDNLIYIADRDYGLMIFEIND
ncbi:MAG: hypothetical protein GY839_00065 [candidate division Zixibacteria bacterium]|nr:hypothetical protein [candidate division Zixibacteria bacterium]